MATIAPAPITTCDACHKPITAPINDGTKVRVGDLDVLVRIVMPEAADICFPCYHRAMMLAAEATATKRDRKPASK